MARSRSRTLMRQGGGITGDDATRVLIERRGNDADQPWHSGPFRQPHPGGAALDGENDHGDRAAAPAHPSRAGRHWSE
ncbi:hypothetical protein BG452_10175 [Streptomyces sp. CBMA123]|nr:hypothetical protein [Streptomyces sp. CBMA123]